VPGEALGTLPAPQRRALEVALLLAEPGDGELDPRAVGTGLTALLDRMAVGGPLVLALDDAQWIDPASARVLAFALRRPENHRPVAVPAAARVTEPGGPEEATAAELESAAATATARGAAEVAVELQELACQLTPETDQPALVQRRVDPAERRYFAGDSPGARAAPG
jgi:hypothetical protein